MSVRGVRLFLVLAVTVVGAAMATFGSAVGDFLHIGMYLVVCGFGWWAARRERRLALAFKARHDALTALPNRVELTDQLERLLSVAA